MPNHDPEKDSMLPQEIISFLRGEMSADEEKAFLDELRADPDRKARAEAIVQMVSAMRAEGGKSDREIIEAISALAPDEVAPVAASPFVRKPKRKIFRHIAWISSVAAVCICFVFLFVLNFGMSNASRDLGDEYFMDLDSEFVRGEENDSVYAEVEELFAQIRDGRPDDQTISRLAELWQSSSDCLHNPVHYVKKDSVVYHIVDITPAHRSKNNTHRTPPQEDSAIYQRYYDSSNKKDILYYIAKNISYDSLIVIYRNHPIKIDSIPRYYSHPYTLKDTFIELNHNGQHSTYTTTESAVSPRRIIRDTIQVSLPVPNPKMAMISPYLDFAPEIGWNLAIAYLKKNDRENALKVLEQLKELYSDNIGFTEKIVELESKIRDI